MANRRSSSLTKACCSNCFDASEVMHTYSHTSLSTPKLDTCYSIVPYSCCCCCSYFLFRSHEPKNGNLMLSFFFETFLIVAPLSIIALGVHTINNTGRWILPCRMGAHGYFHHNAVPLYSTVVACECVSRL